MKARIMMVAGLAILLVSAAGAQTKVTGKQNCVKPEVVSSTEAGDIAGHTLNVQKFGCTWTAPMELAGGKSKEGMVVEFVEMWAKRAATNGTYVGTMDNGDKFTVSFHDSGPAKDGMPVSPIKGTWSYTSGTGKLKGITGKGTYTLTLNADGTGTADVEGTYTIPPPKAATPKKKTS